MLPCIRRAIAQQDLRAVVAEKLVQCVDEAAFPV